MIQRGTHTLSALLVADNLCIVNPASDYTSALAGLHLVKAAYFSGQHTHSQLRGLNVYKKDGPLFKTKPAAAAGPYIYGATLTPRARRVMHFQPFKLAGNPFLPLCAAPSERVIHGRAPHPATRLHTQSHGENRAESALSQSGITRIRTCI